MMPRRALLDDIWELYDTRNDFSLANDLATQNPAKLKEMQDLFTKEAVAHRALPIDDRVVERVNAKLAGRPDLMGDRTSLTLHAGMKGMSENVFLNVKNRSLTITADVENPAGGANGVILAQGGRFGGWSLYMKAGKPVYVYNFIGLERSTVASPQALPAGRSTVRLEFAYDGGGLGKGGLATIYVNDKKVAEGRIERTQPMIFSADETADVGEDDATPVTEDYKAYDNKFTGKILKVTIGVKEMGVGVKAEGATAGAEAAKKLEAAK
jgi:arylsulfatase